MTIQDLLNLSLAVLAGAAGGLCINIACWFMAMARHEKTKEAVTRQEAIMRGADI